MCNYVAYNRFYKRRFYMYIFRFFISLYAKIKCLQHSVTHYGRVTVRLFFINVIVTALFLVHKMAGLHGTLTNSVTGIPVVTR